MKKFYAILAALFAFMMSAGTPARAISIVSHTATDTCGGLVYNLTLNAAAPANLRLVTYFGDGTHDTGSVWNTSGYNWHTYAQPGIYTVKHVLYLSGAPVDSVHFTDTIMCKNAYISVYLDQNNNCVKDASEPLVVAPIELEIDSAGVKIDTATLMGGCFRKLMAGKTYSLRLLSLPPGLSVTCPSGGTATITVSATGPTIYNFGLQCGANTSFDISANVSMRAGRHSEVANIIVSNGRCTPQTVTLTANLSPKYGYFSYASPAPTTIVGNVLTWVLPNVSISSTLIHVHFERPGAWLLPGDTVHTSFSVTPTAGDANPANNMVVRVDTVTSSFDPNAKTVYPSGDIAPGTPLEYSIEFENDGNAPAENIHVLDTLSASLDINSLKMISSSAPVTNTSVLQAGSYNILRFDLPGINLPDSTHHGQCTGMVVFSIKAKPGLALGTVISNRAGVYFDDNPVVMTNSIEKKIPVPTSVSVISHEVPAAYPNPVHDVLNIEADSRFQSAQIINTLGQVLLDKDISGKTSMDVSTLPNGIYYLVLKGQQGTAAQKIEKQ
jgi:uncharacterized repeat protein (TIGR01451 family)